jgi:hypothetical protein
MGDETEDEADHAHVDHQGVEQEDPDDARLGAQVSARCIRGKTTLRTAMTMPSIDTALPTVSEKFNNDSAWTWTE